MAWFLFGVEPCDQCSEEELTSCLRLLLSLVIMKYNNKTYSVDDIVLYENMVDVLEPKRSFGSVRYVKHLKSFLLNALSLYHYNIT